MTKKAQRKAIAKACGWIFQPDEFGWSFAKLNKYSPWWKYDADEEEHVPFPNYPKDLNAMYKAEKLLNAGQINTYIGYLYKFTKVAEAKSNPWEIIAARVAIHATAAQRAEAFLRTLNLWKD